MGDLHFSQGDGEITFCGAIEMAGWIDFQVDLIKDGMDKYGIKNPIFKPGPDQAAIRRLPGLRGYLGRREGKQHYLDVTSPIDRPASTRSST